MDYKEAANGIITWIKGWFERTGATGPAVIGISGGKDSTIAAKLCIEALGADNVIGVSLPDTGQSSTEANEVAQAIGLKRMLVIPIQTITKELGGVSACAMMEEMVRKGIDVKSANDKRAAQNMPPRVRMTILYYVSQMFNGRVVNTCNLSEDYLGYSTIFGDAAGDFAPLSPFTVTELRGIGEALGIPHEWVWKTPDDGLPHSAPDEEKFGFSYEVLDRYIRTGECDDPAVQEKIEKMHKSSQFKRDALHIAAPFSFLPVHLPF